METNKNRGTWTHAVADTVAEILWPTRCAICDRPGDVLCDACRRKIYFVDTTAACPTCGSPYGILQCTECNDTTLDLTGRTCLPLDALSSAVCIDDATKKMITVFKDHDEFRLCHIIASITARYIDPAWLECAHRLGGDIKLTFIPATQKAYIRRGFDHAELIAGSVSEMTGIPCVSLFARPESTDQRKLGRFGRTQNMAHTMSIIEGAAVPRCIIVVDDICTTGATLYTAADVLKQNGAKAVFGLTFGKVF